MVLKLHGPSETHNKISAWIKNFKMHAWSFANKNHTINIIENSHEVCVCVCVRMHAYVFVHMHTWVDVLFGFVLKIMMLQAQTFIVIMKVCT